MVCKNLFRKAAHVSRGLVSLPVLALALSTGAQAHEDGFSVSGGGLPPVHADHHGPIGVMGDHMHKHGQWMLSYRYMDMHMKGMKKGTHNVSSDEVAQTVNPLAGEPMRMGTLPNGNPRIMNVPGTYRIAPLSMDMQMHMFGLMYGLSDDVTLMGMVNYKINSMDLLTYRGPAGVNQVGKFTGRSEGFGDTKLTAMIRLYDDRFNHWQFNAGMSIPTGSITKKGSVLPPFAGMMGTQPNERVSIDRLAYPMQLGSGTFDALPGLTYTGHSGALSWGAQLSGVIRLHDNAEGYRLGNRIEGTGWLAYEWAPAISTSLRLSGKSEGRIRGRDKVITGGMPLFVAENSGRDELDLHLGFNMVGQEGALRGHRLAFEVGVPLYERVNGLQMSNDWSFTLGWQKAF